MSARAALVVGFGALVGCTDPRILECVQGDLDLDAEHGNGAPVSCVLGDVVLRGALGSSYDLQLPALRSVGGSILAFGTSVGSIDLPVLTSVTGWVEIYNAPLLRSLALPALTYVGTGFTVMRNPQLPQCMADRISAQLAPMPPTLQTSDNGGTPNTCP